MSAPELPTDAQGGSPAAAGSIGSAACSDLLDCPFCGGTPKFSTANERDDRRYVAMELECCVVMTDSIGWGRFKSMTDDEIKAELTASLTKTWNTRANEKGQQ